jgi:uncharacterized membrane protein
MKKFWEVSSRTIAIGLTWWLVGTNLLVLLTHSTGWWPLKIGLFLCITFLPGIALLRVLRITPRTPSAGVLYSFGLSILVLMLSGLIANQLLPIVGVARPLETWWALGVWSALTACIIVGAAVNPHALRVGRRLFKIRAPSSWIAIVLSLLLPSIAVMGAFRLNNGGDALFALTALGVAASLVIYAFLQRRHLSDGLLMWVIFSSGFSILLMTSLRGWDIVGHDIEREFRVYTLTHMHALWDIGLDRNPYNACLSITILPEMFARLLDVSGLVVFKVLLQIIFAVCPAVIYVLLRQYVPKLAALVGSMLFICYPTFINDSAMLTRQGVAYLFFALALLVITNQAQGRRYKSLFLLCALGAILSHYSTAYMFVALFIGAVVTKLFVIWWLTRKGRPLPSHVRDTVVSPLFALILLGMTFLWYNQITATSGGLVTTLQKSVANIPALFTNDNKSSDVSAALLFASQKTQADLYQAYLEETRSHANSPPGSPPLPELTSDNLPITPLGEKARRLGVDPSIITALRQDFAKVLQVLALFGVMYVSYRLLRKRSDTLGFDFTCLSLAGIVLLSLLVVLPVLSVNYGVLRAFQQALLFLILPMMLLLVRLVRRRSISMIVTTTTTSIVLLLLLFTGVFAQALGGTSPSLSLNNSGLYYGLYYSSEADTRGFAWVRANLPKKQDVRAANFNRALMHHPDYPFSTTGILPSQINASTALYLDPAQVLAQKVYTYHESSPLILTYPLDYFDTAKNRVYSTGSTRVYK